MTKSEPLPVSDPALAGRIQIRILRASDAEAVCGAYRSNREHLEPWEPLRADEFFTVEGQMMSVQSGIFRNRCRPGLPQHRRGLA